METEMQRTIQNVADIPPLSHTEAGALARVELERFIGLLETLSADDWLKPTGNVCLLLSEGCVSIN